MDNSIKPFKELNDVKKEFTDTEIETLRKKLNEDIYTSEKGTVTHESALQKLAMFELLLCSGIRVGELVRLNYGDCLCQIVFETLSSPCKQPYDGKYYGDKGVVCSRWELEK